MPADLSWLVGKQLIEAFKKDYTWFFGFSDGGRIMTEAPWRLVAEGKICVTSEDHGHVFGLGEPLDAGLRALAVTRHGSVQGIQVTKHTSDLRLDFGGAVILEFLTMSSGFEAWRTEHSSGSAFCLGDGTISYVAHKE